MCANILLVELEVKVYKTAARPVDFGRRGNQNNWSLKELNYATVDVRC